jgi:acid phosphatase type 7
MNKISLLFILSVLITFSAYAQDDIKITHAPYLQNLGENEVTVVWTANKPSIGWVELAPDDGTHYYQTERPKFFNAKNGIKLTSTVHSVHLTGLKPGTRYRYRVYSQEVLSHVGWRVIYFLGYKSQVLSGEHTIGYKASGEFLEVKGLSK